MKYSVSLVGVFRSTPSRPAGGIEIVARIGIYVPAHFSFVLHHCVFVLIWYITMSGDPILLPLIALLQYRVYGIN